MIIGILIVFTVIAAFVMLTNGEKPVEKMQDNTLERLETILTRQLLLNTNAGNLGTDKDMKDRAKLKAVKSEIAKRRTAGFVAALHKAHDERLTK